MIGPDGIASNFDVNLEPDHLHGDDDAVPMQVVDVTSGQSHNGVSWFRWTYRCRCGEQMVVLVRTRQDLQIAGFRMEDAPSPEDM